MLKFEGQDWMFCNFEIVKCLKSIFFTITFCNPIFAKKNIIHKSSPRQHGRKLPNELSHAILSRSHSTCTSLCISGPPKPIQFTFRYEKNYFATFYLSFVHVHKMFNWSYFLLILVWFFLITGSFICNFEHSRRTIHGFLIWKHTFQCQIIQVSWY